MCVAVQGTLFASVTNVRTILTSVSIQFKINMWSLPAYHHMYTYRCGWSAILNQVSCSSESESRPRVVSLFFFCLGCCYKMCSTNSTVHIIYPIITFRRKYGSGVGGHLLIQWSLINLQLQKYVLKSITNAVWELSVSCLNRAIVKRISRRDLCLCPEVINLIKPVMLQTACLKRAEH